MIKKKIPKVLWYDCAELEAMIKYHTAHDIYDLKGEVLDTMVTIQTGEITELA